MNRTLMTSYQKFSTSDSGRMLLRQVPESKSDYYLCNCSMWAFIIYLETITLYYSAETIYYLLLLFTI